MESPVASVEPVRSRPQRKKTWLWICLALLIAISPFGFVYLLVEDIAVQ